MSTAGNQTARRVRFVGAHLPAAPHLDDPERDLPRIVAQLDRLSCGERIDMATMPRTPAGAVPLYEDESGEVLAVLPTPRGPKLVPWVPGTTRDLRRSDARKGGHMPAAALQKEANQPPPDIGEGITRKELLRALMRVLDRLGLLQKAQAPGGNGGGGGNGGAGGSNAPTGAGSTELPGGGSPGKPEFPEFFDNPYFKPVAGFFVSQLAAAWNGGGFNIGGNSLGILSGIAQNLVLGELINRLFPVDDKSSTAEWTIATLGPFIAAQCFGDLGSAGRVILRQIQPRMGPYETAALRIGDLDAKGNAIITGMPSVLIEGFAAARELDQVDKKGAKCVGGAKKLMIGGLYGARTHEKGTGTVSCDAAAPFMKGAANVFVGGPWVNSVDPKARPPIPPQFDQEQFPPSGDHDRSDPKPDKKGTYFDLDSGEWRMYDPDKRGWSASVTEAANASYFTPWDDATSWDFDHDTSVLGGLFDFGSPQWPGAGTGSTWFVPDVLFGIDMSPYFTLHDWIFDPKNITNFWQIFTDSEIPPFLANLNYNPFQILFQIIYSGATTLASIAGWWETIWREVERELGLMGADGNPIPPADHHRPPHRTRS